MQWHKAFILGYGIWIFDTRNAQKWLERYYRLRFINNFILDLYMLENIKFCFFITISKILAAFVTSMIILSIPMVIGMIVVGEEYHGFSHLQIIFPFLACVIFTPLCAQLARECFKSAMDLAEIKIGTK